MPTLTADSIRDEINKILSTLHPLSGPRELSQVDRLNLASDLQTVLHEVEALNVATAFEQDLYAERHAMAR